jgi:hypothetical protein
MATGALPAAPLGIGQDPQAQTEYMDAVSKILQSLESRAAKPINWWKVAGAMADPGRTGNISEAIGKASTSIGQDVEKSQEMALPIAQLRAQLAGQKYSVSRQNEALSIISGIFGTDPKTTQAMIQRGAIPSDLLSKITPQAYMAVALRSPELGTMLKNAAEMETGNVKLGTELAGKEVDLGKQRAEFGEDFIKFLSPASRRILGVGEKPQATPAPVSEPNVLPVPSGSLKTEIVPNSPGPRVDTGNEPIIEKPMATTPGPVQLAEQTATADNSVPLAVRAKAMGERQKMLDEMYKEQVGTLVTWSPERVNSSVRDLRELHDLADKYPQVLGLMQKQGLLNGLAAAAEQGASTPWGSFSLPVNEFLSKVKLPPTEQQALARISNLIAKQFFENARVNKSILGPQISNADVTLLQAPMITAKDSAEAIKYYAKENIVGMNMRGELNKLYGAWNKKYGPASGFSDFFTSSDYNSVMDRFDKYYQELYSKHNPYMGR